MKNAISLFNPKKVCGPDAINFTIVQKVSIVEKCVFHDLFEIHSNRLSPVMLADRTRCSSEKNLINQTIRFQNHIELSHY